jgi:hypothetical protein
MSDPKRNEVKLTLDGKELTMRASFDALMGIEQDLKASIPALVNRVAFADMGVTQATVIIHWGLKGFGDTRLSLKDVGEKVVSDGLNTVLMPVIEFLQLAMHGVSLGKSQEKA